MAGGKSLFLGKGMGIWSYESYLVGSLKQMYLGMSIPVPGSPKR